MATVAEPKRMTRFEMRVSAENRRLFDEAARLHDMPTSQWMVENLIPIARREVSEATAIVLPSDAYDELLAALDELPTDGMVALLNTKPVWDE